MGSKLLIHRRYFVSGRVQGVGFRFFVQQRALQIGVRGYTRNLPDGRVEVYAAGTRDQLNELSASLWQGPRKAEVQDVNELESPPDRGEGFHIRD